MVYEITMLCAFILYYISCLHLCTNPFSDLYTIITVTGSTQVQNSRRALPAIFSNYTIQVRAITLTYYYTFKKYHS